jgi:hypothetical protein
MKRVWKVGALLTGILFLSAGMAASTLTGVVIDASQSKPIPGVTVELAVLLPDSVSFFSTSDASGSYIITAFPGGNQIYVIRCYTPGYAAFYMRYDALAQGDRQVDILLMPEASAPPGGGGDSSTVSGAVLYETPGGARNPVAQATLTFSSGLSQFLVQTGSDGRYSLRVRRASYGLTVMAAGFQSLTAGGLAVDSTGLTLNVLLTSSAVPVEEAGNLPPASFSLSDAFPNPANPGTTIGYTLPRRSDVLLTVYTCLGQKISELVNREEEAGAHEVRFDASSLASGHYFYRLKAGGFVQTKRFILLR